jgi:hypothetical protein
LCVIVLAHSAAVGQSNDARAVDANPSATAKKRVEQKRQELIRIRDRVMRLPLIVIELTKEDEAYLIFETLNTRGMRRYIEHPTEIVTMHLAGACPPLRVSRPTATAFVPVTEARS